MNWIYYQIQPYLPGPPKPKWVTTRILTLIPFARETLPFSISSLFSRDRKGETPNPRIDFSTSSYLRFALPPSQSTQIESLSSGDCSSFLRLSCKVLSNLEGRQLYSHQRFCWIMMYLSTRLYKNLESLLSHSPELIMLGSAMVKQIYSESKILLVRELLSYSFEIMVVFEKILQVLTVVRQ